MSFCHSSSPLVNTWWKYFLLIWGRYGGQQWGGRGVGKVLLECGWVWGVGGRGWFGQAATPVRDCPCLGRLLGGSRGLPAHNTSHQSNDFACRTLFVAPLLCKEIQSIENLAKLTLKSWKLKSMWFYFQSDFSRILISVVFGCSAQNIDGILNNVHLSHLQLWQKNILFCTSNWLNSNNLI